MFKLGFPYVSSLCVKHMKNVLVADLCCGCWVMFHVTINMCTKTNKPQMHYRHQNGGSSSDTRFCSVLPDSSQHSHSWAYLQAVQPFLTGSWSLCIWGAVNKNIYGFTREYEDECPWVFLFTFTSALHFFQTPWKFSTWLQHKSGWVLSNQPLVKFAFGTTTNCGELQNRDS